MTSLMIPLLKYDGFYDLGGIAGDIASAIEDIDNHAIAVVDAIDRDIAGGIAEKFPISHLSFLIS